VEIESEKRKPMTSIYLVRHGRTAWNKEEIFRGRTDISLDETGLREAEGAGEYLKELKLTAIYSSPLTRARQTAEKIAAFHQIEVKPLPGIVDMSFGNWEGHSLKEIRDRDEERYRQWREQPHLLKIPGGESLEEVRKRSMAALEEVTRWHPDEIVVLVSHRVINKVLVCGVLGIDNSHFWQIGQDTTAINLIQYRNGKYTLSFLNETCHLKPLRSGKGKTES
jgi:broad specificity phosphatase PhoE